MTTQSDWRSVKDDPPRPNYEVLICWDGIDAVTTSFRFKNHKGEDCWWNGNYRVMPNHPDWWMEMPKAHDVVDETFGKYKGTAIEKFKENE
jgi:hypothetical protein